MKIQITGAANQHLLDSYQFYEDQSEGLGHYFIRSLYADIDSLLYTAGTHSIHFSQYYRSLSKRFPFAIYYKIKNNTAIVHAVIDCRRNPAWTKKNLS